MALKNYKNFIKTSALVIDVRSVTQALYIYSILGDYFKKNSTVLLWKGKSEDLFFLSKIIKIPERSYVLNLDSRDSFLSLNFKTVRKIKKVLESLKTDWDDYTLCTCFASGLYFELIKNFLRVRNKNVIQFDDGLINEYIVKRKYRFLRFVINLLHGFIFFPSKYTLFSDDRYNFIFTCINPKNIHMLSDKFVINIIFHVKRLFRNISLNNITIEQINSALFMSSPLVESGRMTKLDYQKLITKTLASLKGRGFKKIYLSKHPSEKDVNDRFYRSLGLDFSYTNYPSEIIIYNKNIRAIVNPLNSTLFLANHLDLLKKIKFVISYIPLRGAFIASRISKISTLLEQKNIPHHIVTFDE